MSEVSTIKFKTGDIVKIPPNGPEMSVSQYIYAGQYKDKYHCQWFAGKKLNSGFFFENQLVLVKSYGSQE